MKNNYDKSFNTTCITQVGATILKLLDVDADEKMAPYILEVYETAQKKFMVDEGYPVCDRIFMYNPDAIGSWVFNYYDSVTEQADVVSDLKLPMLSVVPPVTPVCFGSMYSGLQPSEHGIQKYEKPVLKCTTVFDKLIEDGKKIAIISTEGDSISLIFLERNMDYFIYNSVKACNEKAIQLINEDIYDVIVLYNTNYDYWMHRVSPKGALARKALRDNIRTYCQLKELISQKWTSHNVALAFAPDHGSHRKGILGTHGINKPCDMNIYHLWSFI